MFRLTQSPPLKTYFFGIFIVLFLVRSGPAIGEEETQFPPGSDSQPAAGAPGNNSEVNQTTNSPPTPTSATAPTSQAAPTATASETPTVVADPTPLKERIERTIERLQVPDMPVQQVIRNEEARHFVIRQNEETGFDPEVRTIAERNRAAIEKEREITRAVEVSLRNLETKKLSPAEQATLAKSLDRLEKSSKNESDYFQIISQIMNVADPSGHPIEDAKEKTPVNLAPMTSTGTTPSSSPENAPTTADAQKTFYLLEQQMLTGAPLNSSELPTGNNLFPFAATKPIPKAPKEAGPKRLPLETGKTGKAIGEPLSSSNNRPSLSAKFDIPGVTTPRTLQDRAKEWIQRIASLLGTKKAPSREIASATGNTIGAGDTETRHGSPSATESAHEQKSDLFLQAESAQSPDSIYAFLLTSLGAKTWSITILGLIGLYTLWRKTGFFR